MQLLDAGRYARRAINMLRGKDVWAASQAKCRRVSLGNEHARWCVCPDGLSPSSVVYSAGVGEDISFDLELIRRFGVQVHAFDPTPRSIEWLEKQSLPAGFVFHAYGLADFDGTCQFFPPANPAHVSHTLVGGKRALQAIEVPVHRLTSIMKMLCHGQIDLLKMDIEGAEYGVIADFVACHVVVEQLLVEFHHRWPELGVEKTKQAIQALNETGYRIFSISPSGEEYSFKYLPDSGALRHLSGVAMIVQERPQRNG